MSNRETLTKIFLKQSNTAISAANLKVYSRKWWQNNRDKTTGGLRLTESGYNFLHDELNLKFYEIPLPRDQKINTQTIIFLDQFIDCPYYLTERAIFVSDEKKSMELYLFSGDLQKYGIVKAMSRHYK